jgi:Zn-dependent metalloprotease
MNKSAALILSLSVLLHPAHSAQTIRVNDLSLPTSHGFQINAPTPGASTMTRLAPDQLQPLHSHISPKTGMLHVRYQQLFQGLPVIGQQLSTHTTTDNTRPQVNGKLALHFRTDIQPLPAQASLITPADLIAYFQAIFPQAELDTKRNLREVIYIDTQHQAHHAYRIEFFVSGQHPRRPVFYIDTRSQKILHYHNRLMSLYPTKAHAHGGHVETPHTYGRTPGFPALDIRYGKRHCYLINNDVTTVDLQFKTTKSRDYLFSPPSPVKYACRALNNYINPKQVITNGAINVENDAHYFGTVVANMYRDWYEVPAVKGKLIMRVHYGKNFNNAFWDGMTMTFGDGNATSYPLLSLEITGHEVSHGFTQYHSNLEYHDQPGAANESFSDMAGKASEYYAHRPVHWSIGETIVRPGKGVICEPGASDAMRCMNDPHKSQHGLAINDAREYPGLVESAEFFAAQRALDNQIVNDIITAIASEAIDHFFKNGEITPQKRDIFIREYAKFLTEYFYDVVKTMVIEDIKQGLIVHNGSGVFNRAFYLLSTTPGWDIRKAFDVMVNANQHYWHAADNFTDIGHGIVLSATELNYNIADILQVLHKVGLACDQRGCEIRQDEQS